MPLCLADVLPVPLVIDVQCSLHFLVGICCCACNWCRFMLPLVIAAFVAGVDDVVEHLEHETTNK